MNRRRARRTLNWRSNPAARTGPSPVRGHSSSTTGPAFFLSYARAGGRSGLTNRSAEVNQPVNKLFLDLLARLPHMVPVPPGQDLGFMDYNMEPGVRWEPELLRNLSSCRVFVALISEPYGRSTASAARRRSAAENDLE